MLYGDRMTMADLFWGIELLRMENVGAAHFWEGRLPQVERLLLAARDILAIRIGILQWPGATF